MAVTATAVRSVSPLQADGGPRLKAAGWPHRPWYPLGEGGRERLGRPERDRWHNWHEDALRPLVEVTLDARTVDARPLGRGHMTQLAAFTLDDGRRVVAKTGPQGVRLDLEGFMLDYLRRHSALPVPAVHLADDDLLVMEEIQGDDPITSAAETHAAELLADLHGRTADAYGFDRDTLIGPLPQPNPPSTDWIAFFREHRLLHMARRARDEGALPGRLLGRIERLAGRLDRLIVRPAPPALIHGDIWDGNVRVAGDRIAGFIDPAIYYADPEIELAFVTLFRTFGTAFFHRYDALRPIRAGFFEVRRDLYNLYPLLVHVRLFGGGYLNEVDSIVSRLAD